MVTISMDAVRLGTLLQAQAAFFQSFPNNVFLYYARRSLIEKHFLPPHHFIVFFLQEPLIPLFLDNYKAQNCINEVF